MKTFSDSDSSHSIDSSFGGRVEDCAVWEKVVMLKLVSTLESVLPTPVMGGMDIGVEVLCAVRMLMLENDRLRKLLGNVCATCGSVNSPGECDVKFSDVGVTRTQSPSQIDLTPRHPTVMTSKVACFATNHRPEASEEEHGSDTSDCNETNSKLSVSPLLVKGDLQHAEKPEPHPESETSLYLTDNKDDNKESELDPNHGSCTDRCHVARGPHFGKLKLHIAARWKEIRRRQKFLLAFAESLMLSPTTSSDHAVIGSASVDDATAFREGLDGDTASVANVDSNAYDSSTDSDSDSGSADDTDTDSHSGSNSGGNSGGNSGTDISVDSTHSISHIAHHHDCDSGEDSCCDVSDVSDCSDDLNPLHSQYAAYIHACNTASRSAIINTDCSDHSTTRCTTHNTTNHTTHHTTHSASHTDSSTAEPDNAQFARDVRSVTQPLAALFDAYASMLRTSGSYGGSGRAGNYGDAYVYELMDKVIVDQYVSGGTTTNESRLAGLMEQLLRLERVVEQQLPLTEEG